MPKVREGRRDLPGERRATRYRKAPPALPHRKGIRAVRRRSARCEAPVLSPASRKNKRTPSFSSRSELSEGTHGRCRGCLWFEKVDVTCQVSGVAPTSQRREWDSNPRYPCG